MRSDVPVAFAPGEDESAKIGPEPAELFEAGFAQHEQGGGECVGVGGGACDDGRQDGVGGRATCAWVDDVAVLTFLVGECLSPDGRDGECAVAQVHDGEGWCLGLAEFGRGVNGDLPGLGVRWGAEAEGGAGAAMEEGRGDAGVAKNLDGLFDGVAFADAAQVDAHAGAEEPCGPVRAVQFQMLHADAFPGGLEGGGIRAVTGSASESPCLHQGRHGDVERPAGGSCQAHCAVKECPDLGQEPYRSGGAVLVESGDFAVGPVEAEAGFESFDLGQGFFSGGAEGGWLFTVEKDFEPCGHGLEGGADGHGLV